MPQVGSKKFPYTSAGVQQAQKHARTTGEKVNMDGYKKGGFKKKKGGRYIILQANRNYSEESFVEYREIFGMAISQTNNTYIYISINIEFIFFF